MTSTPDSEAPKLFEGDAVSEVSETEQQSAGIGSAETATNVAPDSTQSATAEQSTDSPSSTDGDSEGDAAVAHEEAPEFEPVPATPTLEQLELAQAALGELTPASSVGEVHDARQIAEQVLEIRYACNLEGYPDWLWTVSLATVEENPATVLELALLPGEGSMLAPNWVPWAERLAEYLASKEAEEDESDDSDESGDSDDSDESDDDFDDFDDPDASPYSDTDDEPFSPDDDDDDDDSDSDDYVEAESDGDDVPEAGDETDDGSDADATGNDSAGDSNR